MHKINGVFSAALTPINGDYSINLNLFLSHCQRLLKQNLKGLSIFGTTGEGNAFNINEKIQAIEFLIENNISSNKLMPGTGHCSISDTVKFTKKCSELKITSVLVLPAFFYKDVSEKELLNILDV